MWPSEKHNSLWGWKKSVKITLCWQWDCLICSREMQMVHSGWQRISSAQPSFFFTLYANPFCTLLSIFSIVISHPLGEIRDRIEFSWEKGRKYCLNHLTFPKASPFVSLGTGKAEWLCLVQPVCLASLLRCTVNPCFLELCLDAAGGDSLCQPKSSG